MHSNACPRGMGSAFTTPEYVYIRKVLRLKCIFDKDMLKGKKLCWSLPEMKMKLIKRASAQKLWAYSGHLIFTQPLFQPHLFPRPV